ncbi:conserved hypothetical protein [Trichophyton verrucosum HKI 0517]|uniref:Uncharacterized protein n=1 Tax=Trichophyton verrucosum (strain HKI 0517) TaxID=663202 RepID=D4D074_TRIVH|nr:uncharacterized protein TRV_00468 [Trichophyton verrucosum HKI 0517]EFE44796.1 conserved hypothetical protein [Trichophyton verrucosum HKI 0517]
MAQTQSHQLPPRSFSPPASSPSPGTQQASVPGSNIPPPPKRQRLSPLPQSSQPYNSPHFAPVQLSTNGSAMHVNGMAKQAPNAPPPPGSMGPPSRPVEKATDTAELTDVLASSGIDVKEEEAFLTSGYAKPAVPVQQTHSQSISHPPRQQTSFSNSFNSIPPVGPITPSNSFSEQTPKQPGFQPAGYPYQAPVAPAPPIKSPEEISQDEQLRQDTAASRREQYHLQSAFLHTAVMEKKLEKRAQEHGVRMPMSGVFKPLPGRPTGPVEVTGPDGSSVIRRDKTILNPESALGDIISLLSLASEERLRSVIDHSVTLSRNRRVNSHGAVPPEWADLAIIQETAADDNTPTRKAEQPSTAETTVDNSTSTAKKTTTSSTLTLKSRRLIDRDESHEERRAAKRAKRNADAILGADGRLPTPGASTPNGLDRAPDIDKKISKKDIKKIDVKATGAVQHQHAIETARMQTTSLSSRFGKKGGYSWLKSSQPAVSRSGFSTPSRLSTAAAAGSAAGGNGKPGSNAASIKAIRKQFGDWREDKENGAGIQIRDLLFTLEVDGRGLKHLQKAYSKDAKEDFAAS